VSARRAKSGALLRHADRFRAARRNQEGRGVEADSGRVQPALLFPAQPRSSSDSRHDPQLRLGLRVFPEYADGGRACSEAAPEARAGPEHASPFPDSPRRRLSIPAVRRWRLTPPGLNLARIHGLTRFLARLWEVT